VQAFRKLRGDTYASTMCIGNLRSGMASIGGFLQTWDVAQLRKSGRYFGGVLLFALGAGLGSCLVQVWGLKTIWASCVLLMVSFFLMFIQPQQEEE
jgi:uncharacterized membrane protein YoaK (UPF0700 family)